MASSKPLPTILFVHGAWHNPSLYEPLLSLLEKANYEIIAPALPSVNGTMLTFSEDVSLIRSELETLVQAGKEVAVVMHSYGGSVGSEAVKGLSRESTGGPGGVTRLVYLAAFALAEGDRVGDPDNYPLPHWIEAVGENQWRVVDAHYAFYNDVGKDEADALQARLGLHAWRTFGSRLSYTAWKHVDSTYIVCEFDNAIPVAAQETMSRQEGGRWVAIERLATSHSPWLVMPEKTAELVRRGAGEDL